VPTAVVSAVVSAAVSDTVNVVAICACLLL
jgi:hypothetical protein